MPLSRRSFAQWPLALLPGVAAAQDGKYPDKPIRLVVPFAAGGGVDNFARPLARQLSEQLKQQVVIDNRAGASGLIGAQLVAGLPPDGYTLLASTDTSMYLSSLVVKTSGFDPVQNLTPIISAAITPTVVVVHPSVPVKTMKELVEYTKESREPVPYVTAGVGSLHHLTGESLVHGSGARLLHVGYKGGNPALTDLLGGQVKVGILILSVIAPHIQSGKLRAIAVIENHRSKNYPDVPTIAESGIPNFAMPDTSIALWGPAGLPTPIVDRVNAEVQKAMTAPDMVQVMQKSGYEATPGTASAFAAQAVKSYAAYKRMVRQTGLADG
ncbi:Bug family tripartite tricarboxylate transporter substrate binding protein [Ramlibacter alkalitolerans]|uniref:Tripartite tricarboxylate transporter substrate binding protein n=1 Tax=Ramlibacter alkalitolerans TaxID=2039631 RepID=A0ABS1JKK4_9BURK|nr:tripartite tricarboxylate transporter substrate binding protein [Ramlibacter alkalitolerans]MBL0424757.1 tripartite tricarboxylate transporter substrate binding protein [Ramlibacter alkalitolerans]